MQGGSDMPNCLSGTEFSSTHSAKRIKNASDLLGASVLTRFLAFALFLMGANREEIARRLSIPLGTLFSLLNRIGQQGLPAIEDRRRRHSHFLPPSTREKSKIEILSSETEIILDFGISERIVRIPVRNPLQAKIFLLTLVQNGLLPRTEVAKVLGYSATHIERLAKQLDSGDAHALLDKRRGQKQEYRVTVEVKAELIQQFAADAIARGTTSGLAISAELEERCNMTIPARTVRHHMANLGLTRIKHSLPELVTTVKKTSKNSSAK